MKKYAIIVAGGIGTRMESEIPKQFLLLQQKPILQHTLEQFANTSSNPIIILVLPANQFDYWLQLCQQYACKVAHTLVKGGETRSKSVMNALATIEDYDNEDSLVAIHDGVRPLVSTQLIEKSYEKAQKGIGAIACVLLKDSIRKTTGNEPLGAMNRAEYKLVQTPQTFSFLDIKHAYEVLSSLGEVNDTDDASVFERAGFEITIIEGDYKNIKITSPEDLKIATALLT